LTISHLPETPRRRVRFGAIVALSLGALDLGLEQSIVLPALPALAQHYGASLIEIGWFASVFFIAAVAAVPLLGRLGDLHGQRRVLFLALIAFATGSLLCATTSSIDVAIAGRAIQGVGSAVGPLALGIARDTLPRDRLPQAIGAIVGAASMGGALGFLLSGLLSDQFSPAAIFWFLCAFAVVLLVATAVFVPASSHAQGQLDLAGSLLLPAGLVALALAISKGSNWGWSSSRTAGLAVVAAFLLAFFAIVELRAPHPLVDVAVVARRPFRNANVCALLFGFAFFIALVVIPQIGAMPEASGYGLALSTTEIGLLLTPTGVAALAAGWAGGRIVDLVGPRMLVASGSVVAGAAYLALTVFHRSVAALATGSAAIGISWGLILTGIYYAVMRSVAPDSAGVGAAVTVTMRNIGVAIGAQAAFAVITGVGLTGRFPSESGFTRAFAMGAIGAGAMLIAAAFLPGKRDATRRPS